MTWSHRVLLPLPGRPGDPDDPGLTGSLANLAEKLGDARISILDHADRPSQGARVTGHQTFGERSVGHRSQSTGGSSGARPP